MHKWVFNIFENGKKCFQRFLKMKKMFSKIFENEKNIFKVFLKCEKNIFENFYWKCLGVFSIILWKWIGLFSENVENGFTCFQKLWKWVNVFSKNVENKSAYFHEKKINFFRVKSFENFQDYLIRHKFDENYNY